MSVVQCGKGDGKVYTEKNDFMMQTGEGRAENSMSQVTHIANIGPEIREPRSDPNAKIYLQTIFSFSKVSVVLPRCT